MTQLKPKIKKNKSSKFDVYDRQNTAKSEVYIGSSVLGRLIPFPTFSRKWMQLTFDSFVLITIPFCLFLSQVFISSQQTPTYLFAKIGLCAFYNAQVVQWILIEFYCIDSGPEIRKRYGILQSTIFVVLLTLLTTCFHLLTMKYIFHKDRSRYNVFYAYPLSLFGGIVVTFIYWAILNITRFGVDIIDIFFYAKTMVIIFIMHAQLCFSIFYGWAFSQLKNTVQRIVLCAVYPIAIFTFKIVTSSLASSPEISFLIEIYSKALAALPYRYLFPLIDNLPLYFGVLAVETFYKWVTFPIQVTDFYINIRYKFFKLMKARKEERQNGQPLAQKQISENQKVKTENEDDVEKEVVHTSKKDLSNSKSVEVDVNDSDVISMNEDYKDSRNFQLEQVSLLIQQQSLNDGFFPIGILVTLRILSLPYLGKNFKLPALTTEYNQLYQFYPLSAFVSALNFVALILLLPKYCRDLKPFHHIDSFVRKNFFSLSFLVGQIYIAVLLSFLVL